MTLDSRPVIEIDGERIDSLDGFLAEVSRQLMPGGTPSRSLDSFNDILRGGFGTPEGGFVLRWKNSERSRAVLGPAATAQAYAWRLDRCDQAEVRGVLNEVQAALEGRAPTLFDIIVELIRDHGPGGPEAEDGVELRLE